MTTLSIPLRDFSSGVDPNRNRPVRYIVMEARGEDDDEIMEDNSLHFKSTPKMLLRVPSDIGKYPALVDFFSSERIDSREGETQTTSPCTATNIYCNSDGETEIGSTTSVFKRKKTRRSEIGMKIPKREERLSKREESMNTGEDGSDIHCMDNDRVRDVRPHPIPKSESATMLAELEMEFPTLDYKKEEVDEEMMDYGGGGLEMYGDSFEPLAGLALHTLTDHGVEGGEEMEEAAAESERDDNRDDTVETTVKREEREETAMPALTENSYDHNDEVAPRVEKRGGKREKKVNCVSSKLNCSQCDKRISTARSGVSLRQHMRVHYASEVYSCPECDESFSFLTQAKKHIALCCEGEEVVVNGLMEAHNLNQCFPLFFLQSKYDPRKTRDCARCNESVHVDNRAMHIVREHQSEDVWKCFMCSEIFVDEAERVKHIDKKHVDFEMPTDVEGSKINLTNDCPQQILRCFFPQ